MLCLVGGNSGNRRSDCSSTISDVNNSSLLALSLACAVRGLDVVDVSIVTHRLQAACIGRNQIKRPRKRNKNKKDNNNNTETLGVERLTESTLTIAADSFFRKSLC